MGRQKTEGVVEMEGKTQMKESEERWKEGLTDKQQWCCSAHVCYIIDGYTKNGKWGLSADVCEDEGS